MCGCKAFNSKRLERTAESQGSTPPDLLPARRSLDHFASNKEAACISVNRPVDR